MSAPVALLSTGLSNTCWRSAAKPAAPAEPRAAGPAARRMHDTRTAFTIAAFLALSSCTYARLLIGRFEAPSLRRLRRLLSCLQVRVHELHISLRGRDAVLALGEAVALVVEQHVPHRHAARPPGGRPEKRTV